MSVVAGRVVILYLVVDNAEKPKWVIGIDFLHIQSNFLVQKPVLFPFIRFLPTTACRRLIDDWKNGCIARNFKFPNRKLPKNVFGLFIFAFENSVQAEVQGLFHKILRSVFHQFFLHRCWKKISQCSFKPSSRTNISKSTESTVFRKCQ